MKCKVPQWKKDEVRDIKKLIADHPYFGLVDLESLPALQFQRMRIALKDKITVKVTRKRLIKFAIAEMKDSKPNIEAVLDHMGGMVALIFTTESPFRLYSLLAKSKTRASAKPGQIAPYNIIIPAGPTPFAPGPVISEFASVGIKTSVQGGKIFVKDDVVVAREGEKIKQKVAEILLRLGVQPMEIGLNLVAVYDNGIIYKRDVLAIDEGAYYNNIRQASADSIALAMFIGYATKETAELMIMKAERESRSVAKSANIMLDEESPQQEAAGEPKTEFDQVLDKAKENVKVVEDAYKTLMEGGSLS